MRKKVIVSFYDGENVTRKEFDDFDEALDYYKALFLDENIKMADLELETTTTIQSFKR